jgi:hypothetical protein
MKIEIMENHSAVQSRNVPGKDGKPDNTFYSQKAYAHTGGAFPVEFKIPLSNHNDAYRVGVYQLDPESYQVGRFGDLEINRYEMKLIPLENKLSKVS